MCYRRSGPRAPVPRGVTEAQANRAELKALVDAGTRPGPHRLSRQGPGRLGVARARAGIRQAQALARDEGRRRATRLVGDLLRRAVRVSWQGVARALLDGAIAYAKKHGATLLEAYPVDKPAKSADDDMWFGAKSMYDRAGFEEVARRKPQRPVVRLRPA